MDPDGSTISRVERTLWSVWYYLTGAVNRFLRPELSTTEYNDHDPPQQSAGDGEPDRDASAPADDEERPLAAASLLSSSRPVVAWELCSTGVDLGPEEEIMPDRSQLSGGPESEASEEGEATREEQLVQTGTDDARSLKAAKEEKEVEDGGQKMDTLGQDEKTENEWPLNTADDDMSEELRTSGAEEDDHGKMDGKGEDDKMHREEELETEDAETTLCRMTDFSSEEEPKAHVEQVRAQRDEAEEGENGDGVSELGSENQNEYDERSKQVEHQLPECEELPESDREIQEDPGSSSLDDESNTTLRICVEVSEEAGREHGRARGESDENEAERVESEAADHQAVDEKCLTEPAACREEVLQNAEAELQTADSTDKEEEDVAKDLEEEKIAPEKSHVTTTDVSAEDRLYDEGQTEVGSLSSEENDGRESHTEAACPTASATVRPKGETGQEISGELKSSPPGVREGRAAVAEELHSPTSEGTREGVPEHNNEPGPDENTTQRFLEVGNDKEINAPRIPEEVESKELENLQNSGTGGGFSPAREQMEEEQQRTDFKKEDSNTLTGVASPQETEKMTVDPDIKGSGQTDETFSSSMKTRVGQLESETHVGATEETDEKTDEEDGTEELLVDFEAREDLSRTEESAEGETVRAEAEETSIILEADEERMTETSSYRVSGDAEESRIKTLDSDIIESGKPSDEIEPKLPEGGSGEMEDAGIDVEETGSGVEEEEIEDGMETLNLEAELTSDNTDLDLDVMATKEMKKLVAESEESSVSGCQDMIDGEILDLEGMGRREGPEPGGQLVTTAEERSDETGEEAEKLAESVSGESGLVSDTEMSPSAAESGLLDQSVSEWSKADQSESHLRESTSSGSLQDVCDLLAGASESADALELSTWQPDSESETFRSDLTEDESTAETGFHPGSGITSQEAGCLDQEPAETDAGNQKDIDWKDSGEEDAETVFTDEKSEDADAPREVAASDEAEHAEGSGSEVLLQDDVPLTESEDVSCAEKLEEPQDTTWSEDIAEVAEEPTAKDQVDVSVLDFTAQRSRIAVKNPRVRPPKDPRSLLHMPSADPTPSPRLPVRVPTGVPLGGVGIGIKLPGLGAGFPALKKTQRVPAEEKSSETFSQEPETKPEEKSNTIEQEEEKHKPKWMPPRHPGIGNPLLSELKTKLRKSTNE